MEKKFKETHENELHYKKRGLMVLVDLERIPGKNQIDRKVNEYLYPI